MNYPYNATPQQVETLRQLARTYMELARDPKQEVRRELWRRHNALEHTRTPILCSWLWSSNTEWNLLRDECVCQEGILLFMERWLRNRIFHDTLNDDMVLEPWIPVRAVLHGPCGDWGEYTQAGMNPYENLWGENQQFKRDGDAWQAIPFIESEEDIAKRLHPVPHRVNEQATAKRLEYLNEIFDGILPIHMDRNSIYRSTYGGCDLSEALGKFIGIENIYYLVYDDPDLIHALASFMQKAVLANFEQAEQAGDFQPDGTINANTGMPYTKGMEDPSCNQGGRPMAEQWIYTHGQEFASVSAEMHKEFLLDYQIPILSKFKYSSYGCCEDLTHKIDMLRAIPNLRRIAVSPSADIAKCAEQIGTDYTICWKPSPACVTVSFDEDAIRKQIRHGLEVSKGCYVDIILKDIMNVGGDPSRLKRWTQIAMEEAERAG